MALRYPGDTSPLPKPLQKFKPRDLRWLWSFLDRYNWLDQRTGMPLQPYKDLSQMVRVRKMADAIKRHENPEEWVNTIISFHADAIIPDEKLKWIDKEDHRQLIWALFHLGQPIVGWPLNQSPSQPLGIGNQPLTPIMPNPFILFAESRYEEIIAAIDTWVVSHDGKVGFILEKKNEWFNFKTPDKKIKWIDRSNLEQLVWAWEYLVKHNRALSITRDVPPVFSSNRF